MSPNKSHQAIGVFDSGVGGLTVMKEIVSQLPKESTIYFGDTARVPYGGKSRETIIRYSIENSIFLLEKKIKMLVVACNTACSVALEQLQNIFNIPVIGVIEPGVQKVREVTKNQRIAILGTQGTIKSGVYQKEIQTILPQAFVKAVSCPLFVPLVEEQFIAHPATRLIVKEYLKPLLNQEIDTILLGCTHYPLLRDLICEEMGPEVNIVDSASTCANKISELLTLHDLHYPQESFQKADHRFIVSDDPEKFKHLGSEFFGNDILYVEHAQMR